MREKIENLYTLELLFAARFKTMQEEVEELEKQYRSLISKVDSIKNFISILKQMIIDMEKSRVDIPNEAKIREAQNEH